ncbi:uncharacterized GPI-anchored protein At3g06035 [Diospyros lotus]|uniref:uncharacterized GPI-anchored protein At3g06035 n=1 Tax=Diospyros lotus TaxID=55363 RepID=UPI00225BCF83|nr:uncharacterized GPI-anchored protein At3g06035 [Diospyros lotus]
MASSLQLSPLLFLLLQGILLPSLIYCNGDENNLLQGINSYRQSLSLPTLWKNDKAGCLADEIANQLEDQPCGSPTGPITTSSSQTQITNYPGLLRKCKINISTTMDGVVLPVCVPKLVPTLVLTNYTSTEYSRYINDSKYTGVGLGSEDDWMVVVLTTNTPSGSFVSAAEDLVPKAARWMGHCLIILLLGVLLLVL